MLLYCNIQEGKPLFRKTKDGKIFEWKVEKDAPLCTLEEAFLNVDQSLGFNIELKFDDQIVYKEEELSRILQAILKVMLACLLVSAFLQLLGCSRSIRSSDYVLLNFQFSV